MFTLEFLRTPVWQGLTWTLLHFLWEGLAVAVVLLLLLGLFGVRRPQIRYLLCLGAMGMMVLCPIITFYVLVGDVDRGTRQAEPVAASGVAVDLGPGLSPELTMNSLEPPATVATLPLPEGQAVASDGPSMSAVAGQASEPWLWDRLWGHARAAQPYLLAAWVLGVVCLSARLLLGVAAAWWLRRSRGAIPPQLASSVARLSNAMGLRTAGRICVSSRIREAMVVGILRPMVLLPAAWAAEMTPEILEAIIAHELAHIRRWDLWATLFQRLVETLLFCLLRRICG